MWKPVPLPFKNNPASLPLPTPDEIRACTNVLWARCGNKVVAVNDKIVVKFGSSIQVNEGQGLVYLQQHAPKVPAPRLYAMFHDSAELFLVMQRIPGTQLDKIWPSLRESEKDEIITKLRQTFDTMRQIKSPWANLFCGLDGGPVPHYLFHSHNPNEKYLGPFKDEAEFVAGIVKNFRITIEHNHRPDFKVRFYETHFARVLQGHRPILTHGDLQQKNIMVTENGRNRQGERSFDVVLVDWANSGWYPDFWEFFCASLPFPYVYWEGAGEYRSFSKFGPLNQP